MFKRIISVILTVVLCMLVFTGCKNDKSASLNNYAEEKDKFDEEQILFAAQDRCDIDGDRDNIYFYNYKGDMLNTKLTSGTIGYSAENGLAPALDPKTYKVGFVDKDGVFKIEPIYEDAAPFSKDGIALVKMEFEENGETVEKCGYINSKGEEISACIYDDATSFFDCGYALVAIYKPETDEYGYTYRTNWKECIVNKKGEIVIEIDTITEKREIRSVYKDYFVCGTESGIAIYDYGNTKLCEISQNEYYTLGKNYLEKWNGEKTEKFDGKKFVEVKPDPLFDGVEMTSKRVATTQSGTGYGVTKNGETVIPFEYDRMYYIGGFFVAVKYIGSNINFNQMIDIYDKEFNKTAENINYGLSLRSEIYGENCQLPDGYFQVMLDNEDYGHVCGIIDYTGKVIVEPVFGRGIRLYTYEGTGKFDFN